MNDEYYVEDTQEHETILIVNGTDNKPIVTIKEDGRIEYGENYTPDKAAIEFWTAMRNLYDKAFDYAPIVSAIIQDYTAYLLDCILTGGEEGAKLTEIPAKWLKEKGIDPLLRDPDWHRKLFKNVSKEKEI